MSKQQLKNKQNYRFADLVEIMDILRAPDGCPWDKEQTHRSIRNNLIEETYEAIEGIDKADNEMLCEELGDMLLQIVFHSKIATDEGAFDINAVIDKVCKKLIFRHPHIFDGLSVEDCETVLSNWNELKKKEKGQADKADVVKSICAALPSLMRAQKIVSKSKDNTPINIVIEQLKNSVDALKSDGQGVNQGQIGEILFSVCHLAKMLKIDAEEALFEKNEAKIGQIINNNEK